MKALFHWFFRLSDGLAASPLKGSPTVYLSQEGRLLAQCLTADSSQNWSENSQPDCSGPVSLGECSWQRQFMFRLDCLVVTGHLCPIMSSVEALIFNPLSRQKEDVVAYWTTGREWSFSFKLLVCLHTGVDNGFSGITWRLVPP